MEVHSCFEREILTVMTVFADAQFEIIFFQDGKIVIPGVLAISLKEYGMSFEHRYVPDTVNIFDVMDSAIDIRDLRDTHFCKDFSKRDIDRKAF